MAGELAQHTVHVLAECALECPCDVLVHALMRRRHYDAIRDLLARGMPIPRVCVVTAMHCEHTDVLPDLLRAVPTMLVNSTEAAKCPVRVLEILHTNAILPGVDCMVSEVAAHGNEAALHWLAERGAVINVNTMRTALANNNVHIALAIMRMQGKALRTRRCPRVRGIFSLMQYTIAVRDALRSPSGGRTDEAMDVLRLFIRYDPPFEALPLILADAMDALPNSSRTDTVIAEFRPILHREIPTYRFRQFERNLISAANAQLIERLFRGSRWTLSALERIHYALYTLDVRVMEVVHGDTPDVVPDVTLLVHAERRLGSNLPHVQSMRDYMVGARLYRGTGWGKSLWRNFRKARPSRTHTHTHNPTQNKKKSCILPPPSSTHTHAHTHARRRSGRTVFSCGGHRSRGLPGNKSRLA